MLERARQKEAAAKDAAAAGLSEAEIEVIRSMKLTFSEYETLRDGIVQLYEKNGPLNKTDTRRNLNIRVRHPRRYNRFSLTFPLK